MPSALGSIPLDERVLTEADVLPYDSEVEYLESTGTQYIDTGVGVANTLGYVARAKFDSSNTWLCGARSGYNQNQFGLFYDSNGRFVSRYGNTEHYISGDEDAHTFSHIGNVFSIDGVVKKTFTQQTFSASAPFYLFSTSLDNSGTPATAGFVGRIYSCDIYSGSALVRSFVPVRVGQVGYLFDRVSGQLFGNAGTGAFLYGGDVREVEYIESTGTQYIDTGIDAAVDVDMSIDAVSLNTDSTQFHAMGVFTTSSNSGYALFCSRDGMITGSVGNDVRVRANGIDWNTRRLVELKNGELIVDGTSYGLPSPMPASLLPGNHIWLMWLNGIDVSLPSHPGRLYGAKIYKSGVLVRDFIPYRIGNKGCLYDRVSGKFFTNAGTGDFAVGADVPRLRYFDPDRLPQWEEDPSDVSCSFSNVGSGFSCSVVGVAVNRIAGLVRLRINIVNTAARTAASSVNVATIAFTGFTPLLDQFRWNGCADVNRMALISTNSSWQIYIKPIWAMSATAATIAFTMDLATNSFSMQ